MDTKHTDRRTFLKSSLSTAAIAAAPLVLTPGAVTPRRPRAPPPNPAASRASGSPPSA